MNPYICNFDGNLHESTFSKVDIFALYQTYLNMSNIISQSEKVTVQENTELQAAMITINGRLESKEYREAMLANFELAKKPHVKYWLQDNTEAGVLSLEDQQWVAQTLIPKANEVVEKIAIIISKDVFRKFASKNIIERGKEKGNDKLNISYFNSLDEAIVWLKS